MDAEQADALVFGATGDLACKAWALASIEAHSGGADGAARRLVGLLRYLDRDCNDPATFRALRDVLGDAARPVHYLVIPPSLFGVVARSLTEAGCARDARVVVEKPFGRDPASARALIGRTPPPGGPGRGKPRGGDRAGADGERRPDPGRG